MNTITHYLKNVLNRASAAGTATSIAFVAEECIVALKSLHMSSAAAYQAIKLLSSYTILGTAFIEPIAEILIDKFNISATQIAKFSARIWYALLDVTYTACICFYFLDSFNNKSPTSYWYAVALPSIALALIASKELRMALHLFPTTRSSKLHNICTRLLDVSCETVRGFILGYDVMFEIGYEIPTLNSAWLSTGFGCVYSSFHGTIYHFRQLRTDGNNPKLAKLDTTVQTMFTLLTTVFFSFYIKEAMADTYPHEIIQIIGFTLIVAYILGRPCWRSQKQPLLDEVAEEEERTIEEKTH